MYNAVGGDALTNFNVRKMHILYKRCLSEVEKKKWHMTACERVERFNSPGGEKGTTVGIGLVEGLSVRSGIFG